MTNTIDGLSILSIRFDYYVTVRSCYPSEAVLSILSIRFLLELIAEKNSKFTSYAFNSID